MNILVIDIGGTNVKILATGHEEVRKLPSGPGLTPQAMVDGIKELSKDWEYESISIGYPGPVIDDKPLLEPKNLHTGWVGFDFAVAFGKPVKIINDAALQALGSYEGGRMLFLGLGTGLGSALIIDKTIIPLELAHLPYKKKKTFEDYVGLRGIDRMGRKKWETNVGDVCNRLKAALVADYVVLGGGNAKKLKVLPEGSRMGDNANAFKGGYRLWEGFA
ncbi:MAG: ROK family protein [Planctomycetota bacterium]